MSDSMSSGHFTCAKEAITIICLGFAIRNCSCDARPPTSHTRTWKNWADCAMRVETHPTLDGTTLRSAALGASAGGLEACETFFKASPPA
jgi:hypothetical protein